jgi:hypothetical protein
MAVPCDLSPMSGPFGFPEKQLIHKNDKMYGYATQGITQNVS